MLVIHANSVSLSDGGEFAKSTIEKVVFQATEVVVGHYTGSYLTDFQGVFYQSKIGDLVIGSNVKVIPELLFCDAIMELEELTLQAERIGAFAFASEQIFIGHLTMGQNVKVFAEYSNSTTVFHHWEQFFYATIGEVYYEVTSLMLEDEVGEDHNCYGPFFRSKIGQLYLSDEVKRYPAYCFLEVYLEQDMLEIHAESIGVRAFSGKNISIGTLTIGTEVKTFESIESGYSIYFRQFTDCTMDTLIYLPICAETGVECDRGVFDTATVGNLVIGSEVEKIPNYLFYNMLMEMEDFTLNVPEIGYQSFASDEIFFGTLTIGEDVTVFGTDSKCHNQAFSKNTIGMLYYNSSLGQLDSFTGGAYGPFSYHTQISGLVIGENVEVILYECFRGAKMELTELQIEKADIGYATFDSSNVHIGRLYIGNEVSYLGTSSDEMNCFRGATIDFLHYNSNVIEPEWSTSSGSYGMFSRATIGELQIGEDVEVIPAFWFRNATLTQEELTLSCDFSYYSFYGENIKIGTLTLNGDMAEFHGAGGYNRAFSYATIGTVMYNLPCTIFKNATDSPFYKTNITTFIVGENVTYMDYRLLRGNTIPNCYVYAVHGSEDFLSQNLTENYLPTCTNLHIHYNSDFKTFFSKEVTEYHWLCVEYFDTTYGEKLYDEETGEYKVELFKTCSVCGYEEESSEALDGSYDVYLSLPVEISLVFDAEQKSYIGQEVLFAYGTLGNAYEGVSLTIDTEAESYGTAIMGENSYDISDYLSVGFGDGEFAIFDTNQLLENAKYVSGEGADNFYQEQMNILVDGMAFVEGGTGEYQISIPLRFELVK